MVVYKDGRKVRLVSRRGADHTKRFADIAAAVRRLPARTLILDGEVCVFDEGLVSHMHLLMDPARRCARDPAPHHRSVAACAPARNGVSDVP
jgi:ATP-dependent DNA ligase